MSADDNLLWWHPDCEKGERHRFMMARVKELEEEQYATRQRDLRHRSRLVHEASASYHDFRDLP